jgi:hypothetical protein
MGVFLAVSVLAQLLLRTMDYIHFSVFQKQKVLSSICFVAYLPFCLRESALNGYLVPMASNKD